MAVRPVRSLSPTHVHLRSVDLKPPAHFFRRLPETPDQISNVKSVSNHTLIQKIKSHTLTSCRPANDRHPPDLDLACSSRLAVSETSNPHLSPPDQFHQEEGLPLLRSAKPRADFHPPPMQAPRGAKLKNGDMKSSKPDSPDAERRSQCSQDATKVSHCSSSWCHS
ncbi:hypothetical protein VTK26DRAFT_8108 [Humicola hyalothermophila]